VKTAKNGLFPLHQKPTHVNQAIFMVLNPRRTPANLSLTKESRPPLVWRMHPSVA
jgi:hypothetical protein